MKATGIVRYIDTDGTIRIPKAVMEMLGVSAGTPMEMFVSNEKGLVLREYTQDDSGDGSIQAEELIEAVQRVVETIKELYELGEVSSNTYKLCNTLPSTLHHRKDDKDE